MKVKELIEILEKLDGELPVATCANNHEYFSDEKANGISHGSLKISLIKHYAGNHILIGNQYRKDINFPNWYIVKDIFGKTEDIKSKYTFTWKSFMDGKFAINCKTESAANDFMKECEKHNIKWESGAKPSDVNNWSEYKENTCYDACYMSELGFSNIDLCAEGDTPIIIWTGNN